MLFGCLSSLIYGLGLFALARLVFPYVKKFIFKDKHSEDIETNWEKDTVYLYQFNGTSTLSSISPYCVKVEAYLRLHKIPFKRVYSTTTRGKNNKLPMIKLNGQQISDSQIIIRRLQEKFDLKDYDNDRDAALGHAVDRMVDLHTCNQINTHKDISLVVKAIVGDKISHTILDLVLPVAKYIFTHKLVKKAQGVVDVFTVEEKEELLTNDLTRLRDILGDKLFLFGDKPTPADCSLFGQLGAVYYLDPGANRLPHRLLASPEFASLKAWLIRMKEQLFGNEFCM